MEKRVLLLRKMKEVASEQRSCLEQDRMDDYFRLWGAREKIRSQIALDENGAGNLITQNPEGVNPLLGKRANEMAEEIRFIQDIDSHCEELLILKKEALAAEIRDMKKGQQAVRGYGQRPLAPARFIDRRS